MIHWICKWLPIIFGCHCMDDRSFYFNGKKFPLCARCTGELIGIVLAALLYMFIHAGVAVCAVLLLPMILDGFLQALTRYESNNIKRLITGILFGYGICTLFFISSGFVMEQGRLLGEKIKYSA